MPISEDDEKDLKVAVMQADLRLEGRQGFWETPRNIVIIFGAVAAVFGTLGGLVGFKIAQAPPPAPPQVIFQPGSIVVTPAPASAK